MARISAPANQPARPLVVVVGGLLASLALAVPAHAVGPPRTSVDDPGGGSPSTAPTDAGTAPSNPSFSTTVAATRTLPVPVVALAAPAQVVGGSSATITASITAADATGEIAVLEEQRGGTWTGVSSGAVDDAGSVALPTAPRDPGTYSYRVRLAATTKHQAAISETLPLTYAQAGPPTQEDPPSDTPSPSGSSTSRAPGDSSDPTGTDGTDGTDSTDSSRTASSAPTSSAAGQSPTSESPTSPQTSSSPAAPLCGGQQLLRPDGTPWVCTYDDEFDGSSLDPRYWIPQVSATSGLFTGTTDQPACFINDASTIDEHDGDLDLNADSLDAPVSCGSKSSSLVSGMVAHTGSFEQTYGRFEVRAKLPAWTGSGLQETFWLWPDDQLKYGLFHPSSGEIDFAEFYSDYSTLNIPVVHYLFDPSTISYATNTNIYTSYSCTIGVGQYNTYGLDWSPGRITISINGKVCITDNYTATNAPPGSPYAPFDSPFFLALTQAFGTTGNVFDTTKGPKKSTTSVDYVRVWE